MSIFRRSFSRRLPDHLLEIYERIYVFDSCMSTSIMGENEYKSYLGGVVASLRRFHPGASCMVFNFREGDQSSLLSDILIDYDMAVVDYPRDYDGYPLLPLEMIHYFLRSSESWLSLEGQKNVILMNCESGGWPVLAFMLASLLLYKKKYNGEQKTLEMVYKQAPKEILSILAPINPRASQMRYLQYITGRDSYPDWPPSDDAPLLVDFLLLRNLPLFDGGKGCRPVVRVYGQDPSAKGNRSPRLLFSSLMAEEPAWQYPKDELVFVKLELHCQVQGDVFLECIHLYDNLATEEMIFKVMFHTGFIHSNILALNANEIDVPWNAKHKLPKDFKAEVLFRDIDEAPLNITMELGSGGEEGNDSESEFFEVEEIFIPVPSEIQENKGESNSIIVEERLLVDDIRSKDFTLHNGFPRWDSASESEVDSSKEIILLDEGNDKQHSEAQSDVSTEASKKTTLIEVDPLKEITPLDEGNYKQCSEAQYVVNTEASTTDTFPVWELGSQENKVDSLKEISPLVDKGNYKQHSETQSDISTETTCDLGFEVSKVDSLKEKIPLGEGNNKTIAEAKSFINTGASTTNTFPIWDLVSEGSEVDSLKDITPLDKGDAKQHIESQFDVITEASKKTMFPILDLGSEESEVDSSNEITPLDNRNYKQHSEAQSTVNTGASAANIFPKRGLGSEESKVDSSKEITPLDKANHKQHSEAKFEVITEASKKTTCDLGSEESKVDYLKQITPLNEGDYKQHSETESVIITGASKKTTFPVWGLGSNDSEVDSLKEITPLDEGNYKQYSDVSTRTSKKTMFRNWDLGSEESEVDSLKEITPLDEGNYKQHSEAQYAINIRASAINTFPIWGLGSEESELDSSIEITPLDEGHYKQHSEVQSHGIIEASKKTIFPIWDLASEDSKVDAVKEITPLDKGNYKQHSEAEYVVSTGAPKKTTFLTCGLGEESKVNSSNEKTPIDEGNYKQHSETQSDVSDEASKKTMFPRWDLGSEESEFDSSKDITPSDEESYIQHSEAESDVSTVASKNIVVFDSGSKVQDIKVEIGQSQAHGVNVKVEPKEVSQTSSGQPKRPKKNKWQEITAKTITQQRVMSRWVPRSKPPCPEPPKPKAPTYKWIPKGPASPESATASPSVDPVSPEFEDVQIQVALPHP